jgi:hypothetical protein
MGQRPDAEDDGEAGAARVTLPDHPGMPREHEAGVNAATAQEQRADSGGEGEQARRDGAARPSRMRACILWSANLIFESVLRHLAGLVNLDSDFPGALAGIATGTADDRLEFVAAQITDGLDSRLGKILNAR